MADTFDPDAFLRDTPAPGGFDPDAFLKETAPKGVVEQALTPITSYPETYGEMRREAQSQVGRGIQQLKESIGTSAKEALDIDKAGYGIGNVALGALGYVTSPITSAYRTMVGVPGEKLTGIPKEYIEFGAQLATPGLGLPRLPGTRAGTLTAAESRAAREIEKKASDLGTVKEKLRTEPAEIVPGSQQTPFEMTGDPGLGALERKARLRTPTPFVEQAEARAGARLEALEGAQPTGSVADVTDLLRTRRATELQASERGVALADQRARQAAELPGGGYDPATYGNVMRQELQNALAAERARETAFWQQVDPNGVLRLDPMPLQQTERGIYGVMPEGGAAEASLTAGERQLTEIIQNYPAQIPLQELRDLSSLLGARMREELWTNGSSPAYARMSRLRQGIADAEDNVIGELGQRDPDLARRLGEARTATRERAERFGAKPISDVLQREGTQGPYKVQPAQITDRLIPQGNKGYDVAANYLRAAPDSLDSYTDALAGKMRREVTRPDGSVDPKKLEGFIRRHDGVLRAIDERDGGAFSQSLFDVGQAQERLANAAARQRAIIERWEEGELGKLVGAADNEQAINIVGNIFGRIDAVPRARALADAVSTSPAAQAGLRRAVQQYVRRTYVGNAEAVGGTPMIQPRMFQNFMKENEAALRQIMTPEQVESWKAIATEMGRTSRIAQTKTLPGSDTAQNIFSVTENWPWWAADSAISYLTTGVPAPLGHSLQAAKGVLPYLRKHGLNTANKIIDEAMLNPELAKRLLTMKKRQPLWKRPPGAVARTGVLYGATPDTDTQQPAPRQTGGGVPAIGGTGGRRQGATTPAGAREIREGAGQALQDGGTARDQEAGEVETPKGSRERFAAALTGSPVGGGFGEKIAGQKLQRGKLNPLWREDIVRQIKERGLAAEGWNAFWDKIARDGESSVDSRSVDTRARGGGIGGEDYSTEERVRPRRDPGEDTFDVRFGQWDVLPGKGTVPAESYDEDIGARVMTPGERRIDPLGHRGEPMQYRGAPTPWFMLRGMQAGGEVEDEKLPLPGQSRGLRSTAGPTVTSTMREEEIPPPLTNKAGETLPTYILKEWGKGMLSLPERATKAAGELQREGDVYDPGPALETAMTMWGARTPFMRQGDLGIFGGRGAKTANLDMLRKAEEMHAAGASPESIWNQTGWARGPEGKWRFEIPDEPAFVKPTERIPREHAASTPSAYRSGTLEDVMHHPEFFEAYPQFKDMPATVELGVRPGGGYIPPQPVDPMAYRIGGPNPRDVGEIRVGAEVAGEGAGAIPARRILLHEMQHAVQGAEGFAPGANPMNLPLTQRQIMNVVRKEVKDAGHDWNQLTPAQRKRAEQEVRMEMYQRYAGETEARNVEARRDLLATGRQTPPWKTEDVPRDIQLVPADEAAAVGIPPMRGKKPFQPVQLWGGARAPVPGPVGLGEFPTTTAGRILKKTGEGGYSVRLPTGEIPSEGLMMGTYRNLDPRTLVTAQRMPTRAELEGMVQRNIEQLQKEERHLGTWRDPETGNVYVDVSQRFGPGQIRKATKFGERTGQISGWNIGAQESFPVGNWREFIRSPEFHQRMREMEGTGRGYLSGFPAREWWDMAGGPFERVYGERRLPQVAGFTASTAPNTAPRPNLQQMSEYMRRSIRGEPTVQPAWRMPETAMSSQPGKQLPLEQSRIANLLKSQRGELDLLQRNKVREEAAALMGDPNAVVLDRHWARLAEVPERGIYTNAQEGVVASAARRGGSDYDLYKREVVRGAEASGRDPRDFSADVWTGVRHTIQQTDQLYGTKYRGSAIAGESKSYADHFDDLIDEKAAHLGLSRGKMEEELRNGSSTLLGYVLATVPGAYAAYQEWLGQPRDSARPSSDRSLSTSGAL